MGPRRAIIYKMGMQNKAGKRQALGAIMEMHGLEVKDRILLLILMATNLEQILCR